MSRNKSKVYIKEKESSLINYSGQFVYEVSVYINFEGIFSLADHRLFYSDKPIENITKYFNYSKYIEIFCDLYSAPERWLLDNGFVLYVKPEKKKKDEQESLSNKRKSTGASIKTSSPRVKKFQPL